MVSKVEIPKKKTPPPAEVLLRQIEAVKNDVSPEKLKTVEPELTKLEKKIKVKVLADSRGEHLKKLTKENERFEKIREALELRNFFRRFEVSEKVARYLKAHPKKKITNLKPSDFTDDPELQKPKVWENIVEDAQKGLAVSKLLTREDFDWSDPEAYLEKAGELGKKIIDQIDKHPILTAACLIGGAYALYQFFKKDSSLWDKTKGVLAAGISTWLGFSLSGADLHKKGAEKLAVAVAGKENVDFVKNLFGGDKSSEKPNEPEKENRASEFAKDSFEYLAELMPKSTEAIKEFDKNFLKFPPNLPASKESFLKIYESVREEGGNAIFEITKDGTVNLVILGLKGAKEAIVFTWEATPKLISAFGEWLMESENPWWQAGGFLVKADAWLAAAGATVGVTKSLFELTYRPTINPFKITGRLAKGAIKGATIGQYRLVKTAFNLRANLPEMVKAYKGILQLQALEAKEWLWKKPERLIKNPGARGGKHARQLSRIKYFERRAEISMEISRAMSSWAEKGAWEKFREIEESARKRANDLKASLPKTKLQNARAAVKKRAAEIEKRTSGKISGKAAERLAAKELRTEKQKPIQFEIPKKIKGLTTAQVRTEKIRVQFAITKGKNTLPPHELQRLRNELAMLRGYLYPARAMGGAIDVAKIEKLSIDQRITRISAVAQTIESSERGVSSYIAAEIKKLRANFIAGKLTKVQFQKELTKLDKISIRFAKNKVARFKEIEGIYKKIPRKAVTSGLKRQLKRSLDSIDNSFVTRVVRGAKGRAKLAVLMASAMYAIDTAINWNNEERTLMKELQNFGPLMGQVLLDVAPFAGTLSNFYSAFSGEEYVTEMDVSGAWERASNVLWGCVGLAGDTIMVITAIPSGGTSIGANAALRLSKIIAKGGRLAKPAKFLLKNWDAVARIADKSGGWVEFIRKATNSKKVVSNLRRVEKVGMTTGALMLGGSTVNLVYGFLSNDESSEVPTFD